MPDRENQNQEMVWQASSTPPPLAHRRADANAEAPTENQ